MKDIPDLLEGSYNREEMIGSAEERTPSGRLTTPNDVADVTLFLCSHCADQIVGQTIIVDGGVLRGTDVVKARALGADLFSQPVGPGELEIPAIRGVGGSIIHFIDEQSVLKDVWNIEFDQSEAEKASGDAGLTQGAHRLGAGYLLRLHRFCQTRVRLFTGIATLSMSASPASSAMRSRSSISRTPMPGSRASSQASKRRLLSLVCRPPWLNGP